LDHTNVDGQTTMPINNIYGHASQEQREKNVFFYLYPFHSMHNDAQLEMIHCSAHGRFVGRTVRRSCMRTQTSESLSSKISFVSTMPE
jgi:hypothetical protein